MRPVVDIAMPASLAGQQNGRVDPSLLVAIDGGLVLESHAAVAWFQLVEAANRDGVTLTADSAYRTYDRQVELFTTRYTRAPQDTRFVMWNNQPWWIMPGAITAAVPGTSNHGWGLAVDVHTDHTNVPWLEEHEVEHGWSHEAGISESEPWHIHYFAGDTAALPEEDDMTDEQIDKLAKAIARELDARPRSVHSYRDGGQYDVNARTLEEYGFAETQQAALAAQGQQPK